jgi:hypothetical protein
MTERKASPFTQMWKASTEKEEKSKTAAAAPAEAEEPKNDHSTNASLVNSSHHSTTPPKNLLDNSTTPPVEQIQLHQSNAVELRKKDRHSKNKQRVQPSIDKAILKQIRRFLDKNGMELGEYFEMLALHHLDLVNPTKNGSDTPQIDKKIIYRSSSTIINLYEKYLPKNKWTWNDDKEGARFSDEQIETIEVAMIRTLIRAKKPIRTFKYFLSEIDYELSLDQSENIRKIQLSSARKRYEDFVKGIEIDSYS